MTASKSLLVSLRASGISLRVEDGRLLVEAKRGTITPEIRSLLVNRKVELISTLELEDAPRVQDPIDGEAIKVVTGLLVIAYQRFKRTPTIPEVPLAGTQHSAPNRLALSAPQSVHGCEQP